MLPEPVEASRRWLDTYDSLLRKTLRAADAAPLWCGGDALETAYRAILIPATRPLIVAEALVGPGFSTHVVTFVDPRISEENRTLQRFERIADSYRGKFDSVMAATMDTMATQFWTMPAFRENVDAMDGYIWIVESRRHGAYRMVIRDNVRDAPFEALVINILKATGVAIKEDTIGDYLRPSEDLR